MLHALRAKPDDQVSGADDRQVRLGLLAAVEDLADQLRPEPAEAGEHLGVTAIRLARVLRKQLDAARVGDVDLEAVGAERS